ncbi:hypothetical protein L1987_46457 [Smallanthus sonchifolius]|uniref:Uncharacterized protein n=1 Tax=Smallanthus sonchifolius TaxID=185202 RepID=A0ACB9FZI0_9ASTR|nr:hypothetical protein L1987_46457 [Smallanthus sonchifolius]
MIDAQVPNNKEDKESGLSYVYGIGIAKEIDSNSVLYHATMSNDDVQKVLDKQGVILQEDDSSDELEIKKEKIIPDKHILTIEKLPNPWNIEKVAQRKKDK